jgi:hypothetical protein
MTEKMAVGADEAGLELRKSILGKLNMDTAAAHDATAFWRDIARRLGRSGDGSALELAQEVYDVIGESWTDDCELEGNVAVACYETLYSHITENLETGNYAFKLDQADAEEDDADGNRVARFGKIHTNRTTTTVGTLLSLIDQGALILDPPWQREYVWKSSKKQKLIESVFLDIPVPTILLYEDAEGTRHIIDGRQRLETLNRFRSEPKLKLRFKTPGKSIEGWRPGEPLHDAAGKYFQALPDSRKKKFLNYELQTVTFTDLPKSSLYEIFKRYNTGAESLKAQEIRNAVFQESLLHQTIYRMAGEHQDREKYLDERERTVGEELRSVLDKRRQRYGAYNFVGRSLAFMHGTGGTVATAINDFMEAWEEAGKSKAKVEQYRLDFLNAYEAATKWYREPFCTGRDGKSTFHELVATIQIATAHHALARIRAGEVTEEHIQRVIDQEWDSFLYGRTSKSSPGELEGGVLQEKQNTSTHWGKQKEWLDKLLGKSVVAVVGAPANGN